MRDLLNAKAQLTAREIDISEFMHRFLFNSIYDEINMGSENFVISCFENLLKRQPTERELEAGKALYDGYPALLLRKDGNNKKDLIRIVSSVDEFYQGIAIDWYRILLVREPSSLEMVEGLETVKNDGIAEIQIAIILSQEYRGF